MLEYERRTIRGRRRVDACDIVIWMLIVLPFVMSAFSMIVASYLICRLLSLRL
jgi:hypothetical protein